MRSGDERIDAALGPFGETRIARPQPFVEQKDFWVDSRRDSESETHDHPGGVCPHGESEILTKLGGVGDRGRLSQGFLTRHAQEERAGENVLVSGVLDVEARTSIEEG